VSSGAGEDCGASSLRMADPDKALTLRSVTIGRKNVAADHEVWVFGRSGSSVDVEYRGERGRVAADALAALPITGPDLEQLRQLDACFGLPDEAFESVHLDIDRYFEIVRCRAHGRRFLRDTCGGVAMYTRTILLEDTDEGSPADIWSKYHYLSDNWLSLLGRTR
jgi:hypothetical protein